MPDPDKMEDALRRIVQWSEAYPFQVFPEPDWTLAREALAVAGITLDSVSAGCMRHVVEGVGRIAKEGLSDDGPGPL